VSELLPSAQAREIRDGLLDYLTTTFALADPDARLALAEFLGGGRRVAVDPRLGHRADAVRTSGGGVRPAEQRRSRTG
jgi:hypothetical protein